VAPARPLFSRKAGCVQKPISRAGSRRSGRSIPRIKIFRFIRSYNCAYIAPSRARQRGVRVVTNVGREMRWTVQLQQTSVVAADGEVAWSWRPDAGVKPSWSKLHKVTVAKEPGHRGEREVSRKPSRGESRSCSGSPVVLPPCFFCCTGPMGAIGTRLSLRPLNFRWAVNDARLGQICRENAFSHLLRCHAPACAPAEALA
jgi:hypothetical protein